MRIFKFTFIIAVLTSFVLSISAKDVYVKGYYRKDGTYVRSHYRSSPDQYKSNNYGPSKTDNQLLNPKTRDNDNDSKPNYLDNDDDNDGVDDEKDNSQYGD